MALSSKSKLRDLAKMHYYSRKCPAVDTSLLAGSFDCAEEKQTLFSKWIVAMTRMNRALAGWCKHP